MKIVIDIPEEYYEEIENMPHFKRNYTQDLILDGTPLPKGHGRLIDADVLIKYCQNNINKTVDCNDIARFPTIIEADEAESESEKMSRYIDADKIKYKNGIVTRIAIEEMPTADVKPIVYGEWEEFLIPKNMQIKYHCKNCDNRVVYNQPYKFCPNCGATMRKEKTE